MNREDILIVCALQEETQNKLDGWNVIYTGCGKVNATYELTAELFFQKKISKLPKLVINFGTAGSDKIPIHTLVDCAKFIQRDMDASSLGFPKGITPFETSLYQTIPPLDPSVKSLDFSIVKNPIGKKYTCGTGDNFVQDVSKELPGMDVFDMEAYALAKTCWKTDIDFVSFKYITDNADESSPHHWLENCDKGVEEFKKVLEHYVNY